MFGACNILDGVRLCMERESCSWLAVAGMTSVTPRCCAVHAHWFRIVPPIRILVPFTSNCV